MTAFYVACGLALLVLSTALAKQVLTTKGIPAGPTHSLGGIVAIAAAISRAPGDGGSRFAGLWSTTRARSLSLGVVAVMAVTAGGVVYQATQPAQLDGAAIAQQISETLSERVSTHVDVTCPSHVPADPGYTFICSLTGLGDDFTHVRVQVDNDRGDIEWQPIG